MPSAQELLPRDGKIREMLVDFAPGTFKVRNKECPIITRATLLRGSDGEYNLSVSMGPGGGIFMPIEDQTLDLFSPVPDKGSHK